MRMELSARCMDRPPGMGITRPVAFLRPAGGTIRLAWSVGSAQVDGADAAGQLQRSDREAHVAVRGVERPDLHLADVGRAVGELDQIRVAPKLVVGRGGDLRGLGAVGGVEDAESGGALVRRVQSGAAEA